MFSKFSEDMQKILLNSKKEMVLLKHPYVGSEHLFLSLLKYDNAFSKKMKEYGITYNTFCDKLVEMVGIGNSSNNWFIYTPLLKRIIEDALVLSKESGFNSVNTYHIIYSLLEEKEGVAIRILNKFGVDIDELLDYYSSFLTKKKGSKKKLIVEEFGVDLTKKASNGLLDPVIGREDELRKMMQILCRRSKNNPLLIGEAGVGKTALVEELARLIVTDRVPFKLKNKRIISLSIATLVSGTKYRGEFEERITKMLKELEEVDDIYLFIDEIHTIMGAGGAEGAIDAANIFKPALARGKIKLIGATTTSEYKKTISKDKAMARRFQTIIIEEPDFIKTVNILKRIKPIYEKYHDVIIEESLLENIVSLTSKYIHDRKQPDKSIDILDEVCSKVALSKKDNGKLSLYKEELYKLGEYKSDYLINQDYANALKIKSKEKDISFKINKLENNNTKLRKKIKISDIGIVISEKTGIPIYEIDGINHKYIDNLSKKLSSTIVGQALPILELVKITKRLKLGYSDNTRPISLLFVGPSGCGKTKLATTYSDLVFGKDKIIRLDGTEYKDLLSINKILGSSAGYVGYDDLNNILEKVKNNPYTMILFDEVEKAHPAVVNLFMQILDDGKITDNKGETIYFNNTIIVFTSNIGFNGDIGFNNNTNKSRLNEYFSIELLNRINKTIYFNKLNNFDIEKIVKLEIKNIKNKFKEKDISISFSNKIINKIIIDTDYAKSGARKIKSILDEYIDTYVIDKLLLGKKEIYVNI